MLLLVLTLGCMARSEAIDPKNDPADPTDPTDPDPTKPDPTGPTVVASSKARLTFKGGELYARALADGLRLDRATLCNELGLYDCVSDVHRISLLDVEPYRTGILEPLDNTVVSTPIAVDRVAISACTRRARMDHADPERAEIFSGDRTAIATKLYRRLLQRDPEQQEIDHLDDLYEEMAAVGDPALDETWGATACFAVATTMEALFY